MRVTWATALFICAPAFAGLPDVGRAADVVVTVERDVAVRDVRPIGVDLGAPSAWGAEQLFSNVLLNPGLESPIDGTLVVVRRAGTFRFSDVEAWNGRPDDFFTGARWQARTGSSAGSTGRIARSLKKGADGFPEYASEEPLALLAGDVVALTQSGPSDEIPRWRREGRVRPETREVRPESPGRQCVALEGRPGAPAALLADLDLIGPRAGKLLPVRGRYRLTLWCRASRGSPHVRVRFARDRSPPFLVRELVPAQLWSETVLDFDAGSDDGPAGGLGLRIEAEGDGTVLVDDVSLTRAGDVGPFRAEVVAALRALAPGLLRDWEGQLGDTLENRLAPPFGRRPTRYRPGGPSEAAWLYSLPELLDLCGEVGADPWVVVPTTFTDDELDGLGRFLAQRHASRPFRRVVLELGNEGWNPLFSSAGLSDPVANGALATRAFARIREAAKGLPLVLAVNGPHADPGRALRFAREARGATALAVAPYVLPSLSAGTPVAEALAAAFADDGGRLLSIAEGARTLGKETVVAEVNLHTLAGTATSAERDALVTSAAAGSALARRLVLAMKAGVRLQCVWSLAGFDTFGGDGRSLVRLFGIARDLTGLAPSAPPRLRPTGLAVALLNRALPGDLHAVTAQGELEGALTCAALRSERGWSAVLVSSSSRPVTVEIRFPPGGRPPSEALAVVADHPLDTNEDSAHVRIARADVPRVSPMCHGTCVTVPPYGLVVLTSSSGR